MPIYLRVLHVFRLARSCGRNVQYRSRGSAGAVTYGYAACDPYRDGLRCNCATDDCDVDVAFSLPSFLAIPDMGACGEWWDTGLANWSLIPTHAFHGPCDCLDSWPDLEGGNSHGTEKANSSRIMEVGESSLKRGA